MITRMNNPAKGIQANGGESINKKPDNRDIEQVILRPVIDSDCDLLYEWVNDKLVRNNAFNSNKIEYENHKSWFQNRKDRNTLIYIALKESIPVGQIRIDIDGDCGIISYSIASKYRGQGIGTYLLRLICIRAKKDCSSLERIVGRVKFENIASQKAFENAGYKKVDHSEYYEYQKIL